MAYTYKNKKTGERIVTSNKITGKNWVPVKANGKKNGTKQDPEQKDDEA